MEKKIAPSEVKAQALRALLQGQTDAQSGEELLSTLVRLSTERVLQEALEQEQTTALGRGRYETRGEQIGSRNGDENGTLKTAEGVLRVKVPQMRGHEEPARSLLWRQVALPSHVVKRLVGELDGGAQRAMAASLENTLGQGALSKSTGSELPDPVREE